jgi:predicted naringenin-chalcone synthase
MSLAILGIGTATPDRSIAQHDAVALAAGFNNAAPGRERTLAALYRHTRIRSRGSVLLEPLAEEPFAQSFYPRATAISDAGPTTAERMARYHAAAGPLAVAAAARAVAAAGIPAADITHLVTCSCTGFSSPGVDLEIVRALGLAASVQRTHVGFMGCHGAFNALRVADAFATADPAACPLVVCVELCSLHFQYGGKADHVVANSIFADGAAAIVGRAAAEPAAWRVAGQASHILPDTADQMGWTIGDHGFEMTLSAQVPTAIGRELRRFVEESLAQHGLDPAGVAAWAVHPGGPRVLASVQEALGLSDDALAASRGVLADHGNMSSATILFIIERLRAAAAGTPCVALAFGPGLTAELAVLA